MNIAVTENITELLKANGITLLPHDEEFSSNEEAYADCEQGSIAWMECYESENVESLTGYGAKMTAGVDNGGLSITSIINSEFIPYDANDADGFVEQVQVVMSKFYRDLI